MTSIESMWEGVKVKAAGAKPAQGANTLPKGNGVAQKRGEISKAPSPLPSRNRNSASSDIFSAMSVSLLD